MNLLFGNRPVLDTSRHNEEVTGAESNAPNIPQFDRQPTTEHDEQVIRVLVLMPDKLTLRLHYHDVVAVELSDGSRLPVFGECGEHFREIYRLHVAFSCMVSGAAFKPGYCARRCIQH